MIAIRCTLTLCFVVVLLTACRSVESIIENNYNSEISVIIIGENGKLIAKGKIPAGTILDLPEKPEEVRSIDYSMSDGRLCKITVDKAAFQMNVRYGRPTIYLTGC